MSDLHDPTDPLVRYPDVIIVDASRAPETTPAAEPPVRPRLRRRRLWLPPVLFAATCLTTYLMGGLSYSIAIMTILTCHEMGHFLQALRYRVPATLPYFIPMPLPPIGTMGAVIAMHPGMGNRRSLFDIAVTGPLAGLVPALFCCWYGLTLSHVVPQDGSLLSLGEPILFQWLKYAYFGPLAAGEDVKLHAIAYAGWVGILITAINLVPISQLDGGHILYALLRKRSHVVAEALLLAAVVAVIVGHYWGWTVMLILVALIGPKHPPTANDDMPLGVGRTVLGWLALAFLIVGFTPQPFNL